MLFLRKHHERVIGGSSGKEDGESKTYQASHLDAQTVTLNSQSDTNLIGSQVAGNRVNANVGGKLNIESLQDEERFKTKSSGGGLEVEFGFGNNWSLSGYGNASKGTTHRKQVNEQAGIFAEEGGYHINADSVHLKGGAIASTNPTNSKLATNKLTFEDIQNESSSSAASASVSGSIKESKEKWVDNETGRAVKPNTENSTKIDSQRSGGISPGLPMFERDSDSSVTRATLTEGTIILNKDTNPTITTAKELGINTDLAQANNQVAQTKDVKAQIQEQQQISTAIGNVKSAVDTYTSNKQEEAEQEVRRLKSRLEKAEQQGNQETVNQLKKDLMQAEAQAENWGTGGSTKRAVDAITNAGLIALSGGSSQSIATAAASPYVNQLIKKATEDYPALNIPTHILWGAVEAELMGGKASTGAISTAAGELGAKYLTEYLYHKEAKDLTETERSQVKEMAKALAGVAGGLAAAGQGASAVKILSESSIGTTVANNAVENNYLKPSDLVEAERKYKACKGDSDCEMRVVEETNELSKKRNQELDEYRQSLERELLAAKRSAEQQCAGNADCYLAYSQEANKHFKEQLNAYLAHVSEGKDFESLARNYYPDDAYFRSIWYGLTNSGPQKTKESLKSAKDYIDNTSLGEALDDTLRIGKKLVRLPKEWIEQDIPAHSVEKALREMTDGNPQDVGEVFFGLTTGAATVSVAGKTMKWIGGKWVRSPDVDYSRDNANLGVNRNKGLNERISNRQKDFYLNEQNLNREAKELAKNIKLPISDKVLEKHIINGEPKGNFFKGGHTTLGNVKVEKVIKEYANGVYEAKVSIPNPRALKDPNAKPFLEKSGKEKDSVSTMFPRTWTQDRLRVELEHAFKNASKVPSTKSEWKGVTKSGVEVRWYVKENGKIDTIYPKPPSYN